MVCAPMPPPTSAGVALPPAAGQDAKMAGVLETDQWCLLNMDDIPRKSVGSNEMPATFVVPGPGCG